MRFANALHRRNHPEGFELEGRIEWQGERQERGLGIVRAGIVRHPEDSSLWACLGDFYLSTYSYDAATNAYECWRRTGGADAACDIRIAGVLRSRGLRNESLAMLEELELPASSEHYWAFAEAASDLLNSLERYEETLEILPPPVLHEGVSRFLRARVLCNEAIALIEGRQDLDRARERVREAFGLDRTNSEVLWTLRQTMVDREPEGHYISLIVRIASWVGEPNDIRTYNVVMSARDVEHAMQVLRELEPDATRDRIQLVKSWLRMPESDFSVFVDEVREVNTRSLRFLLLGQ